MVPIRRHAGRWGAYAAFGIAVALGWQAHSQPNGQGVSTPSNQPAQSHSIGRPTPPPGVSIYKPSCDAPQNREDAEFCETRKAADAEQKSAHWAGRTCRRRNVVQTTVSNSGIDAKQIAGRCSKRTPQVVQPPERHGVVAVSCAPGGNEVINPFLGPRPARYWRLARS